jgi:hypothetical protein
MEAKFASSKWMNDARALQLEVNPARGKKVSPEEQADEDLKLMEIQGRTAAYRFERATLWLEQSKNSRAEACIDRILR